MSISSSGFLAKVNPKHPPLQQAASNKAAFLFFKVQRLLPWKQAFYIIYLEFWKREL
jgi:hypothetical protein